MAARYPGLNNHCLSVVLSSKIKVLCKNLLVQFTTQSCKCFTSRCCHTSVCMRSALCMFPILIHRWLKRYVLIKLCTLNMFVLCMSVISQKSCFKRYMHKYQYLIKLIVFTGLSKTLLSENGFFNHKRVVVKNTITNKYHLVSLPWFVPRHQ